MIDSTPKKCCTGCKIEKTLSNFYISKFGRLGVTSTCRLCVKNKVTTTKKSFHEGYKYCNTCDLELLCSHFTKDSAKKDGYSHTCRLCKQIKYEINQEHLRKLSMLRYYKNKEGNKLKKQNSSKKYYATHNTKLKEKYQVKKDEINKKRREKYNQSSTLRATQKIYKDNYVKDMLKNCPFFKLKHNLRTLIKNSFVNFRKGSKTVKILGCPMEFFMNHIESQFLPWMTWENYGNCEDNSYGCTWHLDHIIPLSWAMTKNELYMLNHWSNFQPLCSKINRIDKRNIIYPLCNIELNVTVYQ